MKEEYRINYQGAWLSLNTVYSTHRWLRNKEKKEWMERFTRMLTEAQIPRLDAFKLHIRYNSRMDCDNLTGGSKILVDTMRAVGIIAEDNKHIYRGLTIEPDVGLKHNTYQITITPLPSLPKSPTSTRKTQRIKDSSEILKKKK